MGDEHDRRWMAEHAIGPMLLLLQPSCFIRRLSLNEGREVMHGQAFIAQSAVNALNEGAFHWFAGLNEVDHTSAIRLDFERP